MYFFFILESFILWETCKFLQRIILYQWLEDSLRSGEKVSEDIYDLKLESLEENKTDQSEPGGRNDYVSSDDEPPDSKKLKVSGDMQITHHAPEASKDTVRFNGPN